MRYNKIQRYTVALSHYQEKFLTNIASRNSQKDRVGRKRAIRQKSLSLISLEKPLNPPKKQGLLPQINNNGINVMDFSLSQGSSLSFPHQRDCHNQNAIFDSHFNQSLPVTLNFFNTENNQHITERYY